MLSFFVPPCEGISVVLLPFAVDSSVSLDRSGSLVGYFHLPRLHAVEMRLRSSMRTMLKEGPQRVESELFLMAANMKMDTISDLVNEMNRSDPCDGI